MKTKLSLIMPIYNGGNILPISIKSILNQSYKNFQLILVNDGSTDGSDKICEEFAKNDKRIQVIHKENGGAGSARNAGIEVADGEFISFPDADDICNPDMYQMLINEVNNSNADLTLCLYDTIKIDSNQNIIKTGSCVNIEGNFVNGVNDVRKCWFDIRRHNIGLLNVPWNKIYRTSIIKENNLRFPTIRRAQDAVFNILYYDKIKSLSIVGEYLYQYNVNDNVKIGKKFPIDAYKCFFTLDKTIVQTISGWNMYYGEYKTLCDNHLIGLLDGSVTLCDNPVWGLTKKEKIEYVKNVISDVYIQKKLSEYSGNVTEIEDLIKPTLKKDAKGVLLTLRKRKIIEIIKASFIGRLYRGLKKTK